MFPADRGSPVGPRFGSPAALPRSSVRIEGLGGWMRAQRGKKNRMCCCLRSSCWVRVEKRCVKAYRGEPGNQAERRPCCGAIWLGARLGLDRSWCGGRGTPQGCVGVLGLRNSPVGCSKIFGEGGCRLSKSHQH